MSSITILGNDPAFANWGFAMVDVDLDDLTMTPRFIETVKTKKTTNRKQVRVASDNLARARLLTEKFTTYQAEANILAAEIPYGGQSASAGHAFGVVTGIIAGHVKPLIEVSPAEVKRAATGYTTATKQEMIEWAVERWPDLPWKRATAKSENDWADSNEHVADALAIVAAAIKTQEFANATAMMKSLAG